PRFRQRVLDRAAARGRSDVRLAAADCGDDVDPRARVQGGVETRALAIDVDVDVRAQLRPGLAEPVAEPGPTLVEALDRLLHGRRVDLEPARQVAEERY